MRRARTNLPVSHGPFVSTRLGGHACLVRASRDSKDGAMQRVVAVHPLPSSDDLSCGLNLTVYAVTSTCLSRLQ